MIEARAIEHSEKVERIASGTLKRYNPVQGIGYIVDTETGKDIRLNESAVSQYGWQTIADGSWVKASVFETPRGLRVSRILDIVAPSMLDDSLVFGFAELDFLSRDYVPARVVRYDAKKGYGFVSPSGNMGQCFLHWSSLAEVGLMDIAPDEVIAVRIGQGVRGRIAASVRRRNNPEEKPGRIVEVAGLIAA